MEYTNKKYQLDKLKFLNKSLFFWKKDGKLSFTVFFGMVFAVYLSSGGVFGQEQKQKGDANEKITEKTEKIKHIEGYELVVEKLNRYFVDSIHVYLTRKDIEALQPDDLGELLRKVPGVNVKSYGGLGGLKTVSIRGLGGQHTNFVSDGFSQTQSQTGQVNLGQIQLDNVESVVVQRGGVSELEIPVTAQVSGNAIVLTSSLASTPKQFIEAKTTLKGGAFQQIENFHSAKVGTEKLFSGVFFKHRQAKGNYPYRFMNYKTVYAGTRVNNDFQDDNLGINIHYNPHKEHQVSVYGTYLKTKQGVPGAIVLYNDFSVQRLDTENKQLKIDYRGKVKNIHWRVHYLMMHDSLFYFDPAYLNKQGELRSDYKNKVNDFGLTVGTSVSEKWHFNAGVQELYSTLKSKEFLYATPKREHFLAFAKIRHTYKKWTSIAQIGFHYVNEKNETGQEAQKVERANPYVEISYQATTKLLFRTYYRNSFRMPNFNELYYNNIGNSMLKPEDAHQLALSSSFTLIDRPTFYFGWQLATYYHTVENMILTIPTKNLFVWSIQNVGKNEVRGGDAIMSLSWKLSQRWNIQFVGNYTVQESLDVSDNKSPSYKHQVAYYPLHTYNGDITLQYNKTGMRFSVFGTSERYMLNENIFANRMDGFTTYDWSIFHRLTFQKKHVLNIQLTIKNLSDVAYSFVRSFVMPGRHALLTISYAFC